DMRIEMEDLQRHVMLEINQGNNQTIVVEKVIGLQTLQQEVQDLKNRIQSMVNEIATLQSTSPIHGQSPQLSPKISSIPSY
ncbi:unnamed protein product, partial [Sphagnum compactum]